MMPLLPHHLSYSYRTPAATYHASITVTNPKPRRTARGGVSIIVTSFWFQIARMIRGDPVMSEPGDLRPIMLKRSCCEAGRCKRFHRASLAGIPLRLSQHLTALAIACR